jgi:ankyrin repeat protein
MEILKELIKAGANVNEFDKYDKSPLTIASQKGHL